MSAAEVRSVFNQAIAVAVDAEEVAKLEMLREFFTNAEFRSALADLSYEMTRDAR